MLAIEDYSQSHFTGLQLDRGGGTAMPETVPNRANDRRATDYDAPWNLPDTSMDHLVCVVWEENWDTREVYDLDERDPQIDYHYKDSNGQYVSRHVLGALHDWHPGEMDAEGPAFQPIDNFQEWFSRHPNRWDLYACGPYGSLNPHDQYVGDPDY